MDYDDLVLIAEVDELLSEPTVQSYADAVALQFSDTESIVGQLESYSGELPIVITTHADGDNTPFSDSEIDSLQTVVEYDPVEAIVIELDDAQKENRLIKNLNSANVDVIISNINHSQTPSKSDLMSIIMEAAKYGDAVYIQTTAKTTNDTSTLLSVINDATEKDVIVGGIATGEIGRHTRAIAPFYGSKLAFAPAAQSQSDNNRYTITIKELFELIEDIEYSDTATSLHDSITNPLVSEYDNQN
ncbi:type I 3-dehydroquinate dehydratase [Haladaptatus sp. DFWS20]|uniref:type I 3-dehydroquinate dehydratase n=1 Tax=Haladaptatus sp. DFWS20 TaxID=3403467 RepID=UPI003EB794EF